MTRLELIAKLQKKFEKAGVESPKISAKELVNKFAQDITEETIQKLEELANRRIAGEPLQYLLGEWDFFGRTFSVGEGVLIPRQDTETLVETVLDFVDKKDIKSVIDLCSGSGCIGITLKKEKPDLEVSLLEKSEIAFEFLLKNVEQLGVDVETYNADLFDFSCEQKFDLIVSNPPYIKSSVMPTLSPEVHCEPTMALDGGQDGLIFYREIIGNWKNQLNKDGVIAVEIGYDQAQEVEKIFLDNGFCDINIVKDICGMQRVVFGTLH